MNKRQQQKAATLEDILRVSGELFIELGYDNTSIQHIAERCGLSKGALYHHFASKEDVLERLCKDHYIELTRAVENVLRGVKKPPIDRLADVIRATREVNGDRSAFAAEFLSVRRNAGNEILKDRMQKYDRDLYVYAFAPLLAEARLRGDCSFQGSPETVAVFIQRLDQASTDEIARLSESSDNQATADPAAIQSRSLEIIRTFAFALAGILGVGVDVIAKIIGIDESVPIYAELTKRRRGAK